MLTVRCLESGGDGERQWQDYVAGSAGQTIYHDIAWRRIYEDSFGYRSFYLAATDNGRVRGVLPLFRVPSPLGRPRLVSVPFRDRGGPLFEDTSAFTALVDEAKRLRQQIGADFVELKTIDPYPDAIADQAGLQRVDHWVNSMASLAGLTDELLLKRLGDKTRNMIRQAERAGLRVVETRANDTALTDWYRLHQVSQRALGLPPFPASFFRLMFASFGERGCARLFFVRDSHDATVAGCIIFREAARAIYAYSASIPDDRKVRPNDLMLFQILRALLNENCPAFDFGSDSPSQAGLLFFKRKWLGDQRVIPRYYIMGQRPPRMTDSSSRLYDLPRQITRHLPLPLARLTLAPLVRYFG